MLTPGAHPGVCNEVCPGSVSWKCEVCPGSVSSGSPRVRTPGCVMKCVLEVCPGSVKCVLEVCLRVHPGCAPRGE